METFVKFLLVFGAGLIGWPPNSPFLWWEIMKRLLPLRVDWEEVSDTY